MKPCATPDCRGRAPHHSEICLYCAMQKREPAPKALTGGPSDYYLLRVERPSRRALAPYTAELQDLLEALELSWNAANIVKGIWRVARHHQGQGKPSATTAYDVEKILYFAHRLAIAEGLSLDQIDKVLDRQVKLDNTPTP